MGRIVLLNRRRARGFSLLEVLIAVVVLATGLLALAALQGRLSQASSEAKVRGRVAAMLSTRMDALRNAGYGSLAAGGPATITSTAADDCDPASPDANDWLDCARINAGLASLGATQTIQTWYGSASFTTPAPLPADPKVAQFKRITLAASWTGADGGSHQVGIASDVSAMALTSNLILPPEPPSAGGGGPIVRTVDPATAGVIPIALGTDSASATTNPVPELVGRRNNQQIVGTKFTVLNYTPPTDGAVVIQKRFENEVIKCSCQYGAGGSNLPEIFRAAQWPAVWTGDRYDVHVPNPVANAPGQAARAGPRAGVVQSPLCQECCRDHHDSTIAGEVKFDPERSDGLATKFDQDVAGALVAVGNTTDGTYLGACRVIRVDGFWRTAADLYARQFGLLETQPEGDQAARSGVPTAAAVELYTGFAKDFLGRYDGSSSTPPTDAQGLFAAVSGIDAPVVAIPQASNLDYRYLHGRGLYVDHLEEQARNRLSDMLDPDNEQGCSEQADCALSFLPFVTVNLTEIATWEEVDGTGVLTINSGNLLASNPTEPSGGRTIGQAPGTAGNRGSMRKSNSGIGVNTVLTTVGGVDPTDDSESISDTQPFAVGGVASGPAFDVRVQGGGGYPQVSFTLGTDVGVECFKPANADHHCVTSAGTALPQPGSVQVANYNWIDDTVSQPVSATCADPLGDPMAATATIAVPAFHNHELAAATIGGVAGTIGPPANDNRASETTAVSFLSIATNDLLMFTLAEQAGSPTYATIASCTTVNGTQIENIVWTRPWEQP